MSDVERFSKAWFVNQLKINSVALISLLTALSGFSYNAWRDHQNELNQNMRAAAFEVLKELGELQTVVNYAHYDRNQVRGNPIDGWKNVLMVHDLSRLLTPVVAQSGHALYLKWQQDWAGLGNSSGSEEEISMQIAETRQKVLRAIDGLE